MLNVVNVLFYCTIWVCLLLSSLSSRSLGSVSTRSTVDIHFPFAMQLFSRYAYNFGRWPLQPTHCLSVRTTTLTILHFLSFSFHFLLLLFYSVCFCLGLMSRLQSTIHRHSDSNKEKHTICTYEMKINRNKVHLMSCCHSSVVVACYCYWTRMHRIILRCNCECNSITLRTFQQFHSLKNNKRSKWAKGI